MNITLKMGSKRLHVWWNS